MLCEFGGEQNSESLELKAENIYTARVGSFMDTIHTHPIQFCFKEFIQPKITKKEPEVEETGACPNNSNPDLTIIIWNSKCFTNLI